jgi:hypothetical protein
MSPLELVKELRRIATRIDNSQNPSRRLVANDLEKLAQSVDANPKTKDVEDVVNSPDFQETAKEIENELRALGVKEPRTANIRSNRKAGTGMSRLLTLREEAKVLQKKYKDTKKEMGSNKDAIGTWERKSAFENAERELMSINDEMQKLAYSEEIIGRKLFQAISLSSTGFLGTIAGLFTAAKFDVAPHMNHEDVVLVLISALGFGALLGLTKKADEMFEWVKSHI